VNLPFILTRSDWEDLKPRLTEDLAEDQGIDPRQRKILNVFRVMDLRVEWSCRQQVRTWNLLLLIAALTLALTILHLGQLIPMFKFAGSLFGT
jgi:hypothetical protein